MNENEKKRNQIAKKYGFKTYQEAVVKLAEKYTALSICQIFGLCHAYYIKIIDASPGGRKAVSIIPKNKKAKLKGELFEPIAAGLNDLAYQARMEIMYLEKSESMRKHAKKIYEGYNFDRWGIYQGRVRSAFERIMYQEV